jgi:hypothetical protein
MDELTALFVEDDNPLAEGDDVTFERAAEKAVEAYNAEIQNELSKPMGNDDESDEESDDEESDDKEDDKSDEEGDNIGSLQGTDEDTIKELNEKINNYLNTSDEVSSNIIKKTLETILKIPDVAMKIALLQDISKDLKPDDSLEAGPILTDVHHVRYARLYYFNGNIITLVEYGNMIPLGTSKKLKDVKGTHYQNTVYRGKLINHIYTKNI